MAKTKILVTGGAGYIGSILVPFLLEKGFAVTVIDNFMYRQNSLAHICYHPHFEVVKSDIRHLSEVKKQLADVDIVIPLAALVGAPLCKIDPFTATAVNYEATVALFKLLSKDQWVLMPTTNSAYGSGDKDHFCTEESPLNPISQYAEEKVKVEKELMQLPNAISYRLATVFGMSPRMRTDLLVNDFVYRSVNDRAVVLFEGHFKRNYIHVRDVARAFLHGIEHFDKMHGQIYNVGLTRANLSKKELAERIQKHLPDFVFVTAPIGKDPDQRNYIVSNAKIEKTGFKPEVSLDQGIQELIKGFRMIKNSLFSNV
ncbi:MAG TPA: NAD(P)-dependent oxidoreductase [Bdellovibrionota bacterium]|nr:NAD(P)-dependent oxidoreductase [Bdellovibrionota bacterium]